MHDLKQICKVTIAVFLTTMVAVLFSTIVGCKSGNSEEKVVRWLPTSRDTIPETLAEDSLDMLTIAENIVEVSKPVADKNQSTTKSVSNNTTKSKQGKQKKNVSPSTEETLSSYALNDNDRSWSEEFDLESLQLTIITSDVELQITQNLN